MKNCILFLGILFLFTNIVSSQVVEEAPVNDGKESKDKSFFIDLSKTTNYIDTLLIDRDLNNWSIRAIGSFRQQRFNLTNNSSKFIYTPNNPYGIGLGIGTKKLTLDFTFNIKGHEENPTERFDLLGSFFKKNHLVDFYYQQYQGFNVENVDTGSVLFREDIRSISSAVRYMYMFHKSEYSIAAMKSGFFNVEKSTINFGVGGFFLFNSQRADNSIIPHGFNENIGEYESVREFEGTGGGVMLGFSSLIVLPHNFFITLNVAPGIGLMEKNVKTEIEDYKPENPVIHQLGLSAMLGYTAEHYYVNLLIANGFYSTDFDFGNEVVFGYLNAKLAIGYKLKGKVKKNWKK